MYRSRLIQASKLVVIALLALVTLPGLSGTAQQNQVTGVEVLITQPLSGFVTSNAQEEIAGKATVTTSGISLFMVIISVNGVATKVNFSSDGRFQTWVDLVPGANTITAIAVASNKAVASRRISVIYNPQLQVIFFDNFDEVPNAEWSSAVGSWVTINGQYTVGRDIRSQVVFGSLIDLNTPLNAYAIDVDVNLGDTNCSGTGVDRTAAYLVVRAQDLNNGVILGFGGEDKQIKKVWWAVRQKGDWGQALAVASVTTKVGEAVHVRVEVEGKIYRAYINGKGVGEISDPTFEHATNVGLGGYYDCTPQARTAFDNFSVTSTAEGTSLGLSADTRGS